MPQIRLRQRHGSSFNTFFVNGSTGGTAYAYAPFLADRTVHRTPLVAQDEDVIDLQAEVATPFSPTVTTWAISGPAVQFFYSLGNGKIAWNAANRANVPTNTDLILSILASNANGTSNSATLTVHVPSNANCYFVSYSAGNDAAAGTTPATAWQHPPKNYDCTSAPASTTTLGANNVLFFKAEIHRVFMAQSNALLGSQLPHAGTSFSSPFVYSGTGWGGRATIDGSEVVTGWSAVTSPEVFNNPNFANIKKADLTAQGGAAKYFQQIFDDASMLYPAQWPTPSVLQNFEDPTVNQTGGMWQIPYPSAASPGMSQSAGTVTIRDPAIAAHYGNITISQMPLKVMLWAPGNNITYYDLANAAGATYDFATSTITFPCSASIDASGGLSAYALTHHPLDIVQAGQYALSSDGLTPYAWFPNNGTISISRKIAGANIGQVSYVTFSGFKFQRQSGDGASLGRGSALAFLFSSTATGYHIDDAIVTQIRCDGGDGALIQVNNGASGKGLTDSNIERASFIENPRSSGIRCGGYFQGLTGTPTPAQVMAYGYGKIRYCYVPQYGMGRTVCLLSFSTGIEFSYNVVDSLVTVHGNGLSLYTDSATCFTKYNVVRKNFWNDVARCYTTSSTGVPAANGRFNYFEGNVILSYGAIPALDMFSGESQGLFERNIIMGGAGYTYAGGAANINAGYTIAMSNNVVAGVEMIGLSAATGQSVIYTITNNLLMKNLVPSNVPPNQIQTGNTVSAVAPTLIWNYVITAEMAAALGPGQVGTFWSV